MRAIKEYYYNIVLPYSPQVLKTLPIVESLDIDMIAPDHGLIHRGEKSVKFIVDMYRQMAEQKPRQRAMVIYDTMWHSTEKMAYAVCSGLEEVSLSDKMLYVEDFCKTHRNFSFRNLLEAQASKVEVIVTFLAILELMKVGKIFISQEHTFDDIKIESKIAA